MAVAAVTDAVGAAVAGLSLCLCPNPTSVSYTAPVPVLALRVLRPVGRAMRCGAVGVAAFLCLAGESVLACGVREGEGAETAFVVCVGVGDGAWCLLGVEGTEDPATVPVPVMDTGL